MEGAGTFSDLGRDTDDVLLKEETSGGAQSLSIREARTRQVGEANRYDTGMELYRGCARAFETNYHAVKGASGATAVMARERAFGELKGKKIKLSLI